MTDDARFEDAPFSDLPLRLLARTTEDLPVIGALVQDAVCKTADIHWLPRRREVVLILHRFRWEDHEAARNSKRAFERVQSSLTLADVTGLKVRGIEQKNPAGVQSLLTVSFTAADQSGGQPSDGSNHGGDDLPDEAPALPGTVTLSFAGGAEIVADVECLDLRLADLSRPWIAKASAAPDHPD